MNTTDIVNVINAAMRAKCDGLNCRIRGLAHAVFVMDSEETGFPAIVTADNDRYVFIDDDYIFGTYHRLNAKTYSHDFKSGYGDSSKTICTFDMSIVGWGFIKHLSAEALEALIISCIPKKDYQVVKTDFDAKRVSQGELSGIPYFIPEDAFLFRLNYTVKVPVKNECIELDEIFNQ